MKLLFLILAHNEPCQVIELAHTITSAASDARTIIHFDANASMSDFHELRDAIVDFDKIGMVEERIACKWGDISLVQAVLNALREERSRGVNYDYVVLLSGSCLPCRPIQQLERFLTENYGQEFIQAQDESWMLDGLRKERYELYFPVSPSQGPHRFMHPWVLLQRFLGIKRKPPLEMEVRFGSQWWCLTWDTCKKVLDIIDQHSSIVTFFGKTYIPDEMFFNTLVWNLVEKKKIVQFGLTHFQFTKRGKPTVFFDDHAPLPFALNSFFYRKVSPEAKLLRKASLERARGEDGQEDLSAIGKTNLDCDSKTRAQSNFAIPGRIFFDDQRAETPGNILHCCSGYYVFICGSVNIVDTLLAELRHPNLSVFGRVFAEREVDFGPEGDAFSGLRRDDTKIRDLSPCLYLTRIRKRAKAIPVFGWTPADNMAAIEVIVQDPNALIVSIPPMAATAEKARQYLAISVMKNRRKLSLPEPPEQRLMDATAQLQSYTESIPPQLTSALDGEFLQNFITHPVSHDNECGNRRISATFESSIEACSFRPECWFDAILTAIDTSTKVDQIEVLNSTSQEKKPFDD